MIDKPSEILLQCRIMDLYFKWFVYTVSAQKSMHFLSILCTRPEAVGKSATDFIF